MSVVSLLVCWCVMVCHRCVVGCVSVVSGHCGRSWLS